MSSALAPDAYAILGVAWDADDEAIAAAYRGLARRFHPDVAGDVATRRMMEINAAFEAIRTAERRAEYRDELGEWRAAAGQARATAAARQDRRSAGDAPSRVGSATSAPPTHVDDPDRERLRWRPPNDGTGGAGPPPGRPSGSVLGFGRHVGWSLGEIARVDPGYLVWLADKREGRPYLAEIEALLERSGYRPGPDDPGNRRGPGRGVFRR